MPARYQIDKERRLVITTVWGLLTLADALAHQHSLVKDRDFDPSFSQVMDLTQITQYDVDANDIFKIAQRSVFSPESRRAIIVKDDLSYGFGRMFEMLRENAGEIGIRVFRHREEALDWVLSKNMTA
jgi:hypothetical protein